MESPVDRRSGQAWSRLHRLGAERLTFITGVVVVLAVVVLANRWIFTEVRYEDADFAVNSVRIDAAKRFELLIGNYSRVGFSHPGPALLYTQAWGELLFFDLLGVVPAPFNAHVLASVLFNAVFVGGAASVMTRLCDSWMAGIGLAAGAVAINAGVQGAIASTWFPTLYIWPFLLFVVTTGAMLAGRFDCLPWFVLAGGVLIHGHVSFITFVCWSVLAVAVVAAIRWRHGRERPQVDRTVAAVSAAIAALLALPIVLNLILDWPGYFDDYWRFGTTDGTGGHSLGDVAHVVLRYWPEVRFRPAVVVLLLVAATVCARTAPTPTLRRSLGGLVGAIYLLLAATAFYLARGVDDLSYDYIAYFSRAIPVVTLVVIGIAIVAWLRPRVTAEALAMGSIAVCATVVAITAGTTRDPYVGVPWMPEARAAIAARQASEPLVLNFDFGEWRYAMAILEDSRRRDHPACVLDSYWEFQVGDDLICTDAERTGGWAIQLLLSESPVRSLPIVYENTVVRIMEGSVTPLKLEPPGR